MPACLRRGILVRPIPRMPAVCDLVCHAGLAHDALQVDNPAVGICINVIQYLLESGFAHLLIRCIHLLDNCHIAQLFQIADQFVQGLDRDGRKFVTHRPVNLGESPLAITEIAHSCI